MPEPSERDDPTTLQQLRTIATKHYVELTKLAEMYNRLADQANTLSPSWRIKKYSISDYLDRIANSGILTAQPQSSKTVDVKEDRIQSLTVYRTDALKMFAFDDPTVGLKGELFVPTASEVLDALAKITFGEERDSFTVVFSSRPFPGYQARAKIVQGEEEAALREELGIDIQALTKFGRYVVMGGAGTYYRVNLVHVPANSIVRGRELIGRHLWLCEALRKYFLNPPEELYVKVVGLENGAVE